MKYADWIELGDHNYITRWATTAFGFKENPEEVTQAACELHGRRGGHNHEVLLPIDTLYSIKDMYFDCEACSARCIIQTEDGALYDVEFEDLKKIEGRMSDDYSTIVKEPLSPKERGRAAQALRNAQRERDEHHYN